jgi:hypothetical protein
MHRGVAGAKIWAQKDVLAELATTVETKTSPERAVMRRGRLERRPRPTAVADPDPSR